jgi:pimeloyl-ACP methyl ester carboxylesterase
MLEKSGHFPQEEEPKKAIEAMVDFLKVDISSNTSE